MDLITILRLMKLTAIIILATCLQVSGNSFSQKVSFSGEEVPLKAIFSSIEAQTGYVFFYDKDLINTKKPVTLTVKDKPLEEVLKLSLKDQMLDYLIVNKTVIIKPKQEAEVTGLEFSAFLPIKGVVRNAEGQPLAGASISIKGTNETVVSDEKGNFTINANVGQILVVSYVGYDAREITINSNKNLTIALELSLASLLNAVVINTGYQNISRERFVGSFSQLDSINFHRRAGMGIIERLDGTVPGVLFNKKGGGSFPIQIRGISTIGNNNGVSSDPLIIVDNFPMDNSFRLENINPNDVESVTVLKDAAAASIWGSRAGNGVIVITTKRGKYNQRFQLSLSSNVTVEEKPDLYYYPRIDPSDFIDVEQFLFSKGFYDGNLSNASRPEISPVVEILARRRAGLITAADSTARIDSLRQYDVRSDLNKYVYREAIRQQHYLGFSGGNNMMAYQFSLGYNHGLNNIRGSKPDDQYTINTNTSFRPIKNLDIQAGINFVQGINKSYSPSLPITLSPYARLADDNGNALAISNKYRMGYIDTAGAGKLLDWHYRLLDEIRFADITTNTKALRLNLGASYKLTEWLQATVNYQYSNYLTDTRNFKSLQTFETRTLINEFTNPNITNNNNLRYPIPREGILDVNTQQSKTYNLRGTLNVNKSWGGFHQLTALAGGEISDSKGAYNFGDRFYGYNDLVSSYRTNIDYMTFFPLFYPRSSSSPIPSSKGYSEQNINRFVSVLANIGYTYKNRYNLYASARRDGANVFGVNTNNKWKPLWSAGAGWEISKENFYNVSWLPYLKLRASYGYAGNVSTILSGKFIIRYISDVDRFTSLSYSQSGRAPNADLRWEEVIITNVGLDFQLLKGRLSGSFEAFHKRSKDVISTVPFAPTSGVEVFDANSASLKTNGFEFSLNSRNTKGVIEWTSNLALSHAKTVVTDLKRVNPGGYRARDYVNYSLNANPGQIAYGLSSYRWAGLDPNTGDPQGYLNGQVSKNYQSIFNDSVQNQIFHGSALPLYSGFLRNNVSWKGFTLSVNITGRFKYYFREPALELSYSALVTDRNYAIEYYDRWQKPGDELITNVPSMPYPVNGSVSLRNEFYQFAEIHVKRADNIRLQDIRLAYQWNNRSNKKLPFQSVQFFFYPNNLNWILWRAEDSRFDPDFSGGFINYTAAPTPKIWTAGITINL